MRAATKTEQVASSKGDGSVQHSNERSSNSKCSRQSGMNVDEGPPLQKVHEFMGTEKVDIEEEVQVLNGSQSSAKPFLDLNLMPEEEETSDVQEAAVDANISLSWSPNEMTGEGRRPEEGQTRQCDILEPCFGIPTLVREGERIGQDKPEMDSILVSLYSKEDNEETSMGEIFSTDLPVTSADDDVQKNKRLRAPNLKKRKGGIYLRTWETRMMANHTEPSRVEST